MQTISSSCYDAIIIKQENRVYKSTPFQVVFSNSLIKQIERNKQKIGAPYELSLHVNDRKVDIPIKIDLTGRVVFEKRYNRKHSMVSDSSDVSDDDYSQKSSTIDSRMSKGKSNGDMFEDYKNQQAPNRFWEFAWLFNQKKDNRLKANQIQEEELQKINLSKIKEEAYEGEQNSMEPLFHLSLCGHLLKKKELKEQILKTFYENRIQYSSFIKDPPTFINDSNLVMKLDESIYTWQLGITILICRHAYGRELSKQQIQDIIKNKFTKNKILNFISGGSNITKVELCDLQKEKNKESNDVKKYEKQSRYVVKYRKNPDSDKIRKMKLKYGKNTAKFKLNVGLGVEEQIQMKIFLWDHHEKIVISDIDGTITKSDILGQILSKWIHPGVTKLFTEVSKRHYKIIYLTARAIGQYQQTSKFLTTVEEEGTHLPEGPVMMSPDGYYRSFTRQVIYKTPDYLKTKILASLNEVFPNSKNPIYCGFGNRETDSSAYLKINICPQRIFNITEKSIISRESDKQFASTYLDMLQNIDEFFPEFIKDKLMMESSSESDGISEFCAVGLDDDMDGILKNSKAKSVEGDPSDCDLGGIESNELALIGTQSKKRISQHQIPYEDLKALDLHDLNLFDSPNRTKSEEMVVRVDDQQEKTDQKGKIRQQLSPEKTKSALKGIQSRQNQKQQVSREETDEIFLQRNKKEVIQDCPQNNESSNIANSKEEEEKKTQEFNKK